MSNAAVGFGAVALSKGLFSYDTPVVQL